MVNHLSLLLEWLVISRKTRLLCCEASIPGSGSATHEATGDFAGVTEKMVYRRIFDDTLDLTFYVDKKYIIPEFLESWHAFCMGENLPGQFEGDVSTKCIL